MTMIVNLTPHDITIVDGNGDIQTTIPKSGTVARVAMKRVWTDCINGIGLYETQLGEVQDLPEREEGIRYIVSALVRTAVPDRVDLFSPGELVRDDAGRVIGCRGLNF